MARNREANEVLASELEEKYGAATSTEQTDLLADSSLTPVRRPEVGDFDIYLLSAVTPCPLATWLRSRYLGLNSLASS